MAAAPLTRAQRSVAAALLFLGCAALAGVTLLERGVGYRTFGLVEGVFALLLSFVLVQRAAWEAPLGVAGWAAVAYGTVANAQLLELLFPPPGVIEWAVVGALAIVAWSAFGHGSRRRLVVSLGSLALLLALVKFSVVPAIWAGAGPEAGTAFGLGDLAERGRRFLANGEPVRPAGQLLGFVALCLWCLATRLLWVPEPSAPETESTSVTTAANPATSPE